MKKMILALAMMTSANAFASNIVLRCNIPSGDLQEVKIVAQGSQLLLNELDNTGRSHQRVISAEEVESGKITLTTTDKLTTGTLTRAGRTTWLFEFKSPGFIERGTADCY